MAHFPKVHSSTRSPRTSFSRPEPANFKVENQLQKGSLLRLSMTGGCAVLENNIRRGTFGEIEIPTPVGKIRGLIEFLDGRGKRGHSELGFRFVGLEDSDHERLGKALQKFG
jgi:PilZ domain